MGIIVIASWLAITNIPTGLLTYVRNKMKLPFLTLHMLALALFCTAQGQAIAPPVSDNFPFQVGILMDGGTFFILQRSESEVPEQRFCIDGRVRTENSLPVKAKREAFEGGLHPTEKGAKPLSRTEALKIFSRIQSRLETFWGKAKLHEIKQKPIDLDKIDIPAEKEEAFLADKELQNRIATQMLLQAIEKYKNQ